MNSPKLGSSLRGSDPKPGGSSSRQPPELKLPKWDETPAAKKTRQPKPPALDLPRWDETPTPKKAPQRKPPAPKLPRWDEAPTPKRSPQNKPSAPVLPNWDDNTPSDAPRRPEAPPIEQVRWNELDRTRERDCEPPQPLDKRPTRGRIRTVPEPLISNAWNHSKPSLFLSMDALVKNAFQFGGLPRHGVLGEIRLLQSDATREHHARYALERMIATIDAFLPPGWEFAPSKGHLQSVLDAFGKFARDAAACANAADLLSLRQPVEAGDNLALFADQLEALSNSRSAQAKLAAEDIALAFREAIEARLQIVLKNEQHQLREPYPIEKSLAELTAGVGELTAAVVAQRESLRYRAFREGARATGLWVPERAANEPRSWPGLVEAPEVDPRVIDRVLDKLRSDAPFTRADRRDFLNQVFALPADSAPAAVHKSDCLVTLGETYARKNTRSALQESLRCFDASLKALGEFKTGADSAEYQNAVRRCHEQRAQAYLQLAACTESLVGPVVGERAIRSHADAAYRDFVFSHTFSGCSQSAMDDNYVAKTARTKQEGVSAAAAHVELAETSAKHADFTDAHYQLFWRTLETAELDNTRAWNRGGKLRLSPQELESKTVAIESALAAFTSAELTALYHHQLAAGPLARRDTVRDASFAAFQRAIQLRIALAKLYARAPDKAQDEQENPEQMSRSMLHVCRAAQETAWWTERLRMALDVAPDAAEKARLQKEVSKLQRQTFELLVQRAAVYGRLKLYTCETTDLRDALAIARKQGWRAPLARLDFTLGQAYVRQGDLAAARKHLLSAATSKRAGRELVRKAEIAMDGLPPPGDAGKAIEVATQKAAAVERASRGHPAFLKFQDSHIVAEGLQVIADNVRACGGPDGLVWQSFVKSLQGASSFKQWCEIILAHAHVGADVTDERVQRLLTLADTEASFDDPDLMQDQHHYITSVSTRFAAMQERISDACVKANDAAKAELGDSNAFFTATLQLAQALAIGEQIRPNTENWERVKALALALSSQDNNIDEVCAYLKALVKDIDPGALRFIAAHQADAYAELQPVVDDALDIDAVPSVEHNVIRAGSAQKFSVLTLTGQTLFASRCQEVIAAQLAAPGNKNVREIRLVAESLYIDSDITLHGINLVLGADRIEWMKARGNDNSLSPVKIDLSGAEGDDASDKVPDKAANGQTPGESGSEGVAGKHGTDGHPGGDLLIRCAKTCVGFTDEQIAEINLSGGRGGNGGPGGPGGDAQTGREGAKANDAETVRWISHNKVFGGHYRLDRGGRGGPPGQAGLGGALGKGGVGGASGHLVVHNVPEDKRPQLVQGAGKHGDDGEPGAGGLGAQWGKDGLDVVRCKDSWWPWGGYGTARGIGLRCPKGKNENDHNNWEETPPKNEGSRQASHDAAHKENVAAARQGQIKIDVDSNGFAKHVQGHLAVASSDNRRDAFADVVGSRALARDTAEQLAASAADVDDSLKEARALRESTAALVAQAQAQRQTTAETSRIVEGPSKARPKPARTVRVGYDDAPPRPDPDDVLHLALSPVPHPRKAPLVAHDLEKAMDAVNATQGADAGALGELLHALARFLADPQERPKLQQAQELLQQLAEVIATAPPAFFVDDYQSLQGGFDALAEATRAEPLAAVLSRSMSALRGAVSRQAAVAKKAAELLKEAKNIIAPKLEEESQDLRVRRALRYSFGKDRLMRSALAAQAGVPAKTKTGDVRERNANESAWLATRFRERTLRLLSEGVTDENIRDRFADWVDTQFKVLCQATTDNEPKDAKALARVVKTCLGDLGVELEAERARIAHAKRQIDGALKRVCAHLASQNGSVSHLAGLKLEAIVKFLHDNQPPIADPAESSDASEQGLAVARNEQTVEALCESLRKTLTSPTRGARLQLHLERQLESLRPRMHGPDALPFARIKATFEEVYARSAHLSDETLPLAGEVATALLRCTDEQRLDLYDFLGGTFPCRDEVPFAFILQQLTGPDGAKQLHALRGRLVQRAAEIGREAAPSNDADASQDLAHFYAAALALLQQQLTWATATALTAYGAGAAEVSQDDARAFWLPIVERWHAYASLVPDVDFLAVASALSAADAPVATQSSDDPTALVFATIGRAVMPSDAQGTSIATNPEALLDRLMKHHGIDAGVLSAEAKATVFLLLNANLTRQQTARAQQWAQSRLPAPETAGPSNAAGLSNAARKPQNPDLSLLESLAQEFSHLVFDKDCELAASWDRALRLTKHKLALVSRYDVEDNDVPMARIARLLAFIDQGHRHLEPAERPACLAQATAATNVGISDLETSLKAVKTGLRARIGQFIDLDGWNSKLADEYNQALATEGPASTMLGRPNAFCSFLKHFLRNFSRAPMCRA